MAKERKIIKPKVTSKKFIISKEKQRTALNYRKTGMTYAQIAKKMGYASYDGARKAVVAAMDELIREPAEEVLKLEVSRLDAMLLSIWNKISKGDTDAIRTAIQIISRRAKMLGLDMPEKIENSVKFEDMAYYIKGVTDE